MLWRLNFANYLTVKSCVIQPLTQGVASPYFVKDSPLVASEKGINLDQTGHFIGTTWKTYIWQSLLVALTLVKGYILIDPTYVVYKTEG